jgi:hypothetical protein
MSALAALGTLLSRRRDAQPNCMPCTYFCEDPVLIEAHLPGLAILSSGHASVRAQDGLCILHELVINGRRRCDAFSAHDDRKAAAER